MLDDSTQNDNLFNIVSRKIFPFWPVFTGLFILAFLGASLFLLVTTPKYKVTAALIINDEKKGVDASDIIESIDVFTSKKIVENEVEVLQSRALITRVVHQLHLYAPVYEDNFFSKKLAYQSAPVQIQLKNPFDERYYVQPIKQEFVYDSASKMVEMNGKKIPLNEWVDNPFGGAAIQFATNPSYSATNDDIDHVYSFSLQHPKAVSAGIYSGLFVGSSSKLATVVRIEYIDAITKRGEDVVNTLIDAYVQSAIQEKDTLAANTLAFVEDRMTDVIDELVEVEKELEQYRSSEGVVNISEQGNMYLQNVGDYDRRINDINIQLSVLRKVESYVISKRKKKGIVPSTLGLSDPILSRLLQDLYDTEIEYEQLARTTGENNPILASLRNKIENIRPSILENVRNQKSSLQASLGNLTSSSGKYNSALQLLPEQERRLVEISRKKKSINEVYDFLAKKREETALSYAPQKSEARVIEKPEASLRPVSPKKGFVYAIAFLLAAAIGVVIVFGKELFSSKVLFRSDIESYTTVPVLGELSLINQEGKNLLLHNHQDVFSIDQFRNLISKLGLYQHRNKTKTILISSNIPEEGKSYVSANLAQAIALSGRKVLLLDGDLRKANLTAMFDMQDKPGLSQYLNGKAEFSSIVHKTDCAELSIIPCGEKTLRSSELLGNEKLVRLFDMSYLDYDFILIDTPPITLVPDASIFADFTDKTLLVVKHDFTPKYILKSLSRAIESKKLGDDCSIVFNGLKSRGYVSENYGYGQGYGYEATSKEQGDAMPNYLIKVLQNFRNKLKKR